MQTRCVFKVVIVREGLWSLSDIHFMCSNIYGAITILCTYWACFYFM